MLSNNEIDEIIGRLLSSAQDINWIKQRSLFRELYKKFPSDSFWRNLTSPNEVYSLEYFKLSSFLEKKYAEFSYIPTKEIERDLPAKEKIGIDALLSKKIKTIRDFLKHG